MIDILAPFRKSGDAKPPPPDTYKARNAGPGRIITIANEKGGCGKSTMAMHLAVALSKRGLRVATLDLDVRQTSLSHYIANRRRYAEATRTPVAMPEHNDGNAVIATEEPGNPDHNATSLEQLNDLIDRLRTRADVTIVDTPGADTPSSHTASRVADLVLTPVNDSFVDLDVLAQIDPHRKTVTGLSAFAARLLSDRRARKQDGMPVAPWLVARNRIAPLDSRNARDVDWALEKLEDVIGITMIPGFSERVIFRELFLVGLTILDLRDAAGGQPLSRSHLAARAEINAMADAVLGHLPERHGVSA